MEPQFLDASQFPLGVVLPYAGPTNLDDLKWIEKRGWYLCDGRKMPTTLPLFKVIGHLYGEADGVDLFHLPDYRGRFLRGVDDPTGGDAAKRDPDVSSRKAISDALRGQVGSVQDDAFEAHNHQFKMVHAGGADWDKNGSGNRVQEKNAGTSNTGGSETRPKNIYINYLIFGGL